MTGKIGLSLTDGIDTTTNGGKLVFHIMGALAEFERDLIRERSKAGMKAAQKRGNMLVNLNPCQTGGLRIRGLTSVISV